MAFFQRTDGSGVLLLAPGDNIAVATAELPAGTSREIDRQKIVLKAKVDVGHKFAVRPIPSGSRIVKYGAPIGVATRDYLPSDYLPTYTLEDGHQFVKEVK